MICPHCKKPLPRSQTRFNTISDEIKNKAIKLWKQGYSTRDIEYMLDRQISFATVSRIVKELK